MRVYSIAICPELGEVNAEKSTYQIDQLIKVNQVKYG